MTERFTPCVTDCDSSLSEGTAKAAGRKTKLYEQGKLSLGQAAELVGMTKRTFTEILGKYDVSIFNYPATELSRDVKNA